MQPDISNLPLRDIHLPEAISWWPPAIGWWILVAMILLLVLGLYLLNRHRERHKVSKAALQELENVKLEYDNNPDARRFVSKLSILLRRVCITVFPTENIASISGNDWLNFLDQCVRKNGKIKEPLFTRKAASVLLSVPYMRKIRHKDVQIEELYMITEIWIKNLPAFSKNSSYKKPKATV